MKPLCECADPGCPVHLGVSTCIRSHTTKLYRVDMQDATGTLFCRKCACDALNSGLFDEAKQRSSR